MSMTANSHQNRQELLKPASARFMAFSQDHDEAGNRPGGERLASLLDFEALKLAAGAVALSPYIPLLFMGEEFAACILLRTIWQAPSGM